MKKALALLIVGISVSGCNLSINGNEFQKIGSTYKYISGPSLSKAGVTESNLLGTAKNKGHIKRNKLERKLDEYIIRWN